MTGNDMLNAALDYARRGWPVLPLVPGRKSPITTHGFKDATTDEAQIREWWRRYPIANIGLRMGYDSGIGVIDEDNKDGKDGRADVIALAARLGPLPSTFTVYTASENRETGNRGAQYYFTFPGELRDALLKKQLAPGVDLKLKDSYVVAPPSVINGRAYEAAAAGDIDSIAAIPPTWIAECIKPAPTLDDWRHLERPRGAGLSICDEYNIHLNDVLDVPSDARKTSEGYLIKHPIHGASGDGNVSLNMSRDLWHCFRHDTGGDPLTYLAVREGFIDCEDAGPLDRDIIKRCLEELRKEGKVPAEATLRKTETIANVNGTSETYTVKLRKLDDIANVERFLSRHGDSLRWCKETRQWLDFNGAYWTEVSSDYVKRCARDVPYVIRSESALIGELKNKSDKEKETLAGAYIAWARTSSLKVRIDAVIELAKADLEVSIHEFNRDPLLFNCENGTFDIRTGELRAHDRGDYKTHFCPVPYETGSENKRWEEFLERVQPDKEVRDFPQRAAGYSLTGLTNEEALFFCYGEGATGKSTFLETLLNVAASYGDVSKFATFLADRTASGGSPREDITRLIGLRLTVCNEVNKNTRFNAALLKTLVSGELHVARVPYSSQSVSFEPIFKLWLAANDRPHIEYDDDAAFRRFYVVPFNIVIPREEQDKNLKAYFKHDPDAQKAILAWCLRGAVEWYKLSESGRRDGLQAPAEITTATRSYQLAMNPVYEFLVNECAIGCDVTGKPFEVETASLWDAYDNPRSHYDVRKVKSSVSLSKYLKSFGFEPFQETTGYRARKWRYLRLLDPDALPEQPGPFNCRRTHEQIKGSFTETPLHEVAHEKVCVFCAFIRSCVRHVNYDQNPLEEQKPDQTTLAKQVKELLEAWRSAHKVRAGRPELISGTSMRLLADNPEFNTDGGPEYLEQFIERLSTDDQEISALMLELTGGPAY